jgi:hypothetical protein
MADRVTQAPGAINAASGEPPFSEASENLDRLLEWISRVDNKAGFTFIVLSAMLGALAAAIPPPASVDWLACAAAIASAGILLASAACIMLAAFPRTRTPAGAHPSLFYFGTIASLPRDAYEARFVGAGRDALTRDVLHQCHANATILALKFRMLRRSQALVFIALPAWLLTLVKFWMVG